MTVPRGDLLATILAATRRTLDVRVRREPAADLARRAEAMAATPGRLLAALSVRGGFNVIAECKRRSPSRGVLRAAYDPVAIARGYAAAGAAALSILTEPSFFDGALAHLEAVRRAVDLPILRKDFVISEYQLFEARVAGADAVLLIAAALPAAELAALRDRALRLGLDALIEVHDEAELDTALGIGARIIGVNNRNLRTLEVDTAASDRLIARIPSDVVAVTESGLRTRADLERFRARGYRAFLIGERLMTAPDPGAALRDLLSPDVSIGRLEASCS